jgi:ketosteroid isomerase-like protein
MSNTEKNRATAIQFVTTMKDHGGGDERLLTEDFKWILANRTVWTIAKIKAHCERRRTEVMPELPTMTVTTSTAEGDQVALEFSGKCALANGKRYDNFYHFLMLFRNGRICSIREYVDTKLVFDVFGYGPTDY